MKKTSWSIVLLACCLAAFQTGCATSHGAGDQVSVHVEKSGIITVEGRTATMANLPARVRAAGAGTGTRIRVEIQPDTSADTRTAILRTLAGAGYTKAFCVVSKQAFAESAGP